MKLPRLTSFACAVALASCAGTRPAGLGYSDLGVNRKRVLELRAALVKSGIRP